MDNRILPALLVAAMLAFAGCAGAAGDATPLQTASGSTDTNTVTSGGSATVSAAPDLAAIGVAVEVRAETAEAARTQAATRVDQLRSALTDAGYEVETTAFRLNPEYDYSGESRDLVGYRAYHALSFETTPDDAGSAVDLAVDNGATAIQTVQFTLSDETRAELRAEALAAAVEDARGSAETVAGAADRSVGTELSMQVGSSGFRPYDSRVAYETADSGGSTSFEPGSVTVSASVTVTYELQ